MIFKRMKLDSGNSEIGNLIRTLDFEELGFKE